MTYLQALRLMVKAYKAARGAMPKGLDLLKLKMKARQKYLEKFYATHTYVSGGRDLGHWIPNEVREEEE